MSSINLFELFALLLRKRRLIIKIMLVFLVLGAVIALLSPKQYVAKTIILPQIGTTQGLGKKLGGFAKLVGLNLDDGGKNEIFPTLYPIIANSIPFQKEVLKTSMTDKNGDPIILTEYLKNIDLKEPSDYIVDYTVGLPAKAISLFKSKEDRTAYQLPDSTIVNLSRAEKAQIAYLSEHVSVVFNDLEGYIEIYSILPDAVLSAQLTKKVQMLLQDYIIEFNISKAQDELQYLKKRHAEAKVNYEQKQTRLGQFTDRNKNYILSVNENRYEQLKTENDLAYNVYSQLSNELEAAKLKVKRDTPIFTILEPVTIPVEPSGPNKVGIIFIYVFVGLIIGTTVVLIQKFWPELRAKLKQEASQ